MGTLGWIISITGTLGLAGSIAFAFLAPQAALVLWKATLDLLGRILATRIGCAAIAAVICFIVGDFYGDHSGAARVQAEWDAAKVEYAQAMARLQSSTREKAGASVERAQTAEQTKDQSDAKEIKTYAEALPRPAADDCRITDRDLRAAGRLQVEDGRKRRNWRPFHRDPGRVQPPP
jgi:type IV secretory pathway TrbL component